MLPRTKFLERINCSLWDLNVILELARKSLWLMPWLEFLKVCQFGNLLNALLACPTMYALRTYFFYIEGAFSFPSQLVVLNSHGSKCSEHTIVPLEIWQGSWYKIIKARQKVYNQLFHSWLKRQIILFCLFLWAETLERRVKHKCEGKKRHQLGSFSQHLDEF